MSTQTRLATALAAHYEVRKEIGTGGMATVFLARDVKHDRDVAIKVLHPDLGAALGAERFLSEIKTTAKLQHPHILPLIDSGEADTLLYYVMPFVVGESLRQRMDREGQLPISEAIRIAREVAGALDYAHRNGVVHRDIKPENILLNDGQALVADFGIALAVSAAGGARMTQTGLSLGTPQYMSPEQAMGERTIDARSDIYALGAVTYEMLTGEPPFTGPNVQAIVSKIMSQRPTPVSAVRDTVPPTTEDAVMTALCKLPADRFASAAQFAAALTTSSGVFTSRETSQRTGAGRRRMDDVGRYVGIPAIPVALTAIAVAAWMVSRSPPESRVLRYTMVLDSAEQLSTLTGGALVRVALSPDGSTLAYTGGPQGQIFVRNRNEFRARALPGTEGALSPTFSPDGKQIAFSTFTYELKTVSLAGGAITTVADSVVGRNHASWGTDDFIYIASRIRGEINRVKPIAGSVPSPVTKLDSAAREQAHITPFALPGGKGLLFTSLQSAGSARAKPMIAVLKLGSHAHKTLFEGSEPVYSVSGHLLYRSSNGAVMAVQFDESTLEPKGKPVALSEGEDPSTFRPADVEVSHTGTLVFTTRSLDWGQELVWVTRTGVRTQLDSTWRGTIGYPAISPDGRRVAVSFGESSGLNVWIKELDGGAAGKLTTEGTVSSYPAWTPDGVSVSYYSNARTSLLSLWRKRADAAERGVEIVRDAAVESVWSPDGKWLIYRTSVNSPGKGNIYAIRVGVDSVPMSLAATEASEEHPSISPNGRWLAYASSETGRFEIYVIPFPDAGSAKWPISSGGGTEPVWSRDGRELFYRDGSGNMIAVTITQGSTISAGSRKVLFSTFPYVVGPGRQMYDVAKDGRFLMVWGRGSPADRKIFVVENWFQELNKKFK